MDQAPSRSLSRPALYRLVWSKPLSAVAADIGISRNGLAKICDRLLIPYPGRGHWSRRAPRPRPPLPPAPPNAGAVVTITGARSSSRRDRSRLSPEVRIAQIIDATGRIIAKDGLHAVSMKRVAREVGISEAQAHNYFSRRADLLLALARRELEAMNTVRESEVERGHDNLTRVTLSTVAYLRQVAERGALIQMLLNSPEVRAGLRPERDVRTTTGRRRMTERLNSQYGVPEDLAYGASAILTAICLRAGRLLAEGKVDLATAERLCLAIVTAGNRSVAAAART